MVRNRKIWNAWEKSYFRGGKPDFRRNLSLLEAMYREARAFRAIPSRDPLKGLDVKIRMARTLCV